LAIATVNSRLMDVKAFFQWLAGQPGFKSRISYSDCDYFNLSANDSRIAGASRERPYPSLEQLDHVLRNMPASTDFQRRDQAIIATALLTGARDDALASLSIKHFDFAKRQLFQDAREVRTKRRKTMLADFFPVGEFVEALVKDWINLLVKEKLFGPNDPAFPPSERGIGPDGLSSNTGFRRSHWKNADAVRKAFRVAFQSVGLPYFHPHSVRHTLAALGEIVCRTPEEFKAWSQNLGHEKVMTTFSSYGQVNSSRQSEIIKNLNVGKSGTPGNDPDPATVMYVVAFLQRQSTSL
jgi:integrase